MMQRLVLQSKIFLTASRAESQASCKVNPEIQIWRLMKGNRKSEYESEIERQNKMLARQAVLPHTVPEKLHAYQAAHQQHSGGRRQRTSQNEGFLCELYGHLQQQATLPAQARLLNFPCSV